jgi:hypothetical protein
MRIRLILMVFDLSDYPANKLEGLARAGVWSLKHSQT